MTHNGLRGLFLVMLLAISVCAHSAALSCGGQPGPGGTHKCGDGPAAKGTGLPSSSAGNPIDLVTGNKYQEDTDLAPLPGEAGLEFKRHYNSQSDYVGVFGHGWSHSYEARLHIDSADHIQLRQADGRLIDFTRQSGGRYRAPLPSDGYLQHEANGDTHWHWPEGQVLRFNSDGHLDRIETPSGAGLTLRYFKGRLQQLSDPQGRLLSFEYDAQGHIVTLNGPQGRWQYRYDEAGNLVEVVDAQGSRTYQYDDRHRLTARIDRLGQQVGHYAYDALGRAVLSEGAGGVGQIQLSYPSYAQGTVHSIGETQLTNSLGQVSTYRTQRQHGLPLLLASTGPGCLHCPASEVSYTYDNTPRLLTRTEAGQTLHYRYDTQGRLTELTRTPATAVQATKKTTRPDEWLVRYRYEGESVSPSRIELPSIVPGKSHTTTLHYNDHHQLTQVTESGYAPANNGANTITRATALAYDDQQRLATLDGPRTDVDDRLQFAYDADNHLATITLPEGQVLNLSEYDPSGHPRRLASAGQSDTVLDYDPQGHLIQVARGARQVHYHYNAQGRLTQIDTPEGDHIQLQHDVAGRLTELNDHAGHRYTQVLDSEGQVQQSQWLAMGILETVSYLYDAEGRLSATGSPSGARHTHTRSDEGIDTTDPQGGKTHSRQAALGAVAGLLPLGGLESFTDPRGLTTTAQRDDFGRLVRLESPDQGTLHYTYDAAGLRLTQTDALGAELRYRYDGLGRLIEKVTPEGIQHFRYERGQLVETSGPDGHERFTYTLDGELASHTRELGGSSFTTAYRYEAGQLVEKTLPDGQVLRYHHTPEGQLRAITRKSLFSETPLIGEIEQTEQRQHWLYGNGLSRTLTYGKNGQAESLTLTPALQFQYRFDADGHLAELTPAGQFGYDPLGRLTGAETPLGTFRYTYDEGGNRTAKTGPGGEATFAPADHTNRLAPSNGRGSQRVRGADQLDYSSEQRLTKVTRGGQVLAEYRYNSFGERIQKIVYAGNNRRVTYYLYDGHHLSAEIDEQGQIVAQYLYLEHHPLAKLEGRTVYYLHTDHLGTPQLATDAEAHTVWAADYTPLGQAQIKTAQITQNLRFPGQYYDEETGTHDNYHRTYDPQTGRYLQADPIGLQGGANLYAYLSGNPLGGIDPLGLAPGTPGENIKLIGMPDKPVAEMTFGERLSVVLQSAEGAIADTDVKAALAEMIGDLPGTVAVMATLMALQATPIGWLADVILVGAAWYQYGSAAVNFAENLITLTKLLNKADCSEDDLKTATQAFLDLLKITAMAMEGPGKKLGDLIRKVISANKGPSKHIKPGDKDPNKKQQNENPDEKQVRFASLERTREFLKTKADEVRKSLKGMPDSGKLKNGNVAIARSDKLPKVTELLRAHSGISKAEDLAGRPADVKDLVLTKTNRLFNTTPLPGRKNPPENDSEAKLLEEIAAKLGGEKGKSFPDTGKGGSIDLFTELPPCVSCGGALGKGGELGGIIKQFQDMFPGITVRVHWDGDFGKGSHEFPGAP